MTVSDVFDKGCQTRTTHWKQTVFYLNETLAVRAGEKIKGQLMCAPNGNNPRDLDIQIDYEWKGAEDEAKEHLEYKMC